MLDPLSRKDQPFFQTVISLWLDREVSENELKLLEELFSIIIDHGPEAPSAVATIAAANEGRDVLRSVEAGVHEINDKHGGAIEGCARILLQPELDPHKLVEDALAEGKRLPGFGHRIYKDEDPRTAYLFARMQALGFSDRYSAIARSIETELEQQKGTKLVVNIDGAMAVILCELGVKPELMNAFFLWPRVAGLVYRWKVAAGNK